MIKATKDGAVELYYDNVKKLETTDSAVTITAENMKMQVGVSTVGTIFSSSGTHGAPDVLITDKDNNDARAALQVQGNAGATEVLFASSTGNVGIGTTSPTVPLQVTGDISASGILTLGDDSQIRTITGHLTIRPEEDLRLGTVSTDNVLIGRTDAGKTTIQSIRGLVLTTNVTSSNNISSSFTSTGSFGRVEASQFNDDGTNLNVPDYVFETNYVLKSLGDVEEHISASKHLPNIPSMEDVDSWSELSYGDRDMKLLEKIEELTLYIISLQKQINELKQNN